MTSRWIVVGADTEVPPGRADLFCLPGETPPTLDRTDVSIFTPRDLSHALELLRLVFAEHCEIATLGGTEVIGSDKYWCETIEKRCCEMLEDLGNCPIDCWKGARNVIRNSAAVAAGSTLREFAGIFVGKPAICLGAGPSATPAKLEQIRSLARTHVIFACDSMMHACQRAGIQAQFITMIERDAAMVEFVKGADANMVLIAPAVIDPAPVAQFKRHVWWWGGCNIYKWLDPNVALANMGRSAGTLAFGAALVAGCSPIYLVGHDLAYAPGLKGHCDDVSTYAHERQVDDDAKHDGAAVYNYVRFDVPGWNGEDVTTNGLWNLFRWDIQIMMAQNKDRAFICAQDGAGARIEGAIAGELPDAVNPTLDAVSFQLAPGGVRSPLSRVPSILMAFERIIHVCKGAAQMMVAKDNPPLDRLAAVLVINRLVKSENIEFFRYIFRTVYSSLSLRLHLLSQSDKNPHEMHRQSLLILCETLPVLCEKMRGELLAV